MSPQLKCVPLRLLRRHAHGLHLGRHIASADLAEYQKGPMPALARGRELIRGKETTQTL